MDFLGRLKCESVPFRILALLALMLAACGGGASSQENAGTSAVTFQVVWDRPADFQPASLTDCADVATVSAAIYGADGDRFGEGGPWSCATGGGVIAGLPANRYATIGVAGYGPDGTPLYYGQNETPVFLEPGTVDGGVITAGPFVPQLLGPADASIVATNALELRWRRLPGATGYRVSLATDDSFSAESILQQMTITDGSITSARPDATPLQIDMYYYWRVQAVIGTDRLSIPSATRQFSVREVVVTSMTLVDYGPVVLPTTTTTVTFRYSSIDFSQEQSGTIIAHWSAEMASSDYFDLQETVLAYGLLEQSDIELQVGMPPCAGWGGMTISLGGETTHAFSISSEVCSSANWPTGVSNLVSLKDELVATYQP